MLQPHRPGRIPVVLVHGTASSPARWAEMYNELANDKALRDRYEFWLFQYGTGQPVLYSASLLRRELQSAIEELDPRRTDPALRRIVVIGHSQGGLLAKLMAVPSGNRFWDNVTDVPFDKFEAPADAKTLFREGMFFEPLSDVARVIFIATPHQGSFRAVGWMPSIMRRLITMPVRLVRSTQAFLELPLSFRPGAGQVTSVDNMNPDTDFIRTLADLQIAAHIRAHSIIAVRGTGPPEGLDDGVVAYRSAHLAGVESELVVRSGHSAQSLPETIEEVRRILYAHLGLGQVMGPRSDIAFPGRPLERATASEELGVAP
jgi:pimeloyl-ACP methyl ester carboxylesterase